MAKDQYMRPIPTNLFTWFKQNPAGVIFLESSSREIFRRLTASYANQEELVLRSTIFYPEDDQEYVDVEGEPLSYTEFWSRTCVAIEERRLALWLHINKHGNDREVILTTPRIFVFRLEDGLPGYLSWFTEF